jgi:hypothetical protein
MEEKHIVICFVWLVVAVFNTVTLYLAGTHLPLTFILACVLSMYMAA